LGHDVCLGPKAEVVNGADAARLADFADAVEPPLAARGEFVAPSESVKRLSPSQANTASDRTATLLGIGAGAVVEEAPAFVIRTALTGGAAVFGGT
jgi:hypothetical protein